MHQVNKGKQVRCHSDTYVQKVTPENRKICDKLETKKGNEDTQLLCREPNLKRSNR